MIVRWLRAWLGASRPKVIGVFALTLAEAERAVAHARGDADGTPVWVWCSAPAEPIAGCERFVSGPEAANFAGDLRSVWLALAIVCWTGIRGSGRMKLGPLLRPPFRAVILNEAGDFFRASAATLASHAVRRWKDAVLSALRRTGEVAWSLAYRGGEKIVDAARLMYSLAYRAGERVQDLAGLAWSFAFRGGERAADVVCWAAEGSLAALAFLASLAPHVAYNIVTRPRERPSSNAAFHKVRRCDFVEVRLSGRRWPRRRILRSLRNSNADFLVLRRDGDEDPAEPLIATARATVSFAVAKQIAHAAWRPYRAAVKHPFRRLQTGEVTEVFAPWSSLLVVRRDQFVSLGCPRSLTTGGALLALFWKASAAGLRSITAGYGGVVTDEPAMALEDAELAARVALSARFARLAPASPHRLRGNVAWSPPHRRPFRGKPRVLVVSPYLPYPLAHGGAVRIYNLCRSMAGEIDFILACFREGGETVHYDRLHDVFREVYTVDADEKYADRSIHAQAVEYRNSAMADLIRRFCLERKVDLVQIEYTQLAEYAVDTGAIPVVLVEHDITFSLYRQLADHTRTEAARCEYERWRSFERAALQCSNAVWTMSGDDRALALQHGAPGRHTIVVPNGVDLERYSPRGPERKASRDTRSSIVLFVGSFRHLPNLLAFEALHDVVMPEVWKCHSEALLHVVAGPDFARAAANAGREHLLLPHPRITIDGFLEDLRPAYREAEIAVVPLPLSAGTNIKLLEAMACGLPIVSTQAGCQGLGLAHDREILIADLETHFASEIVRLIESSELRSRLVKNARAAAEQSFGWDSIARVALASYGSFMKNLDKGEVLGSTNAVRRASD